MASKRGKLDKEPNVVERIFALEPGNDTGRGRSRHYGSTEDNYSVQVYGPIGGGQVPIRCLVVFDAGQVVKASKRKTAKQQAAETASEARLEAAFERYLEKRGIELEPAEDE
jgi:hypothetical protein